MTAASHDSTSFHFSTEGLRPKQALVVWHEVFGHAVSRRTLSPLSEGSFRVDMTVRRLASVGDGSVNTGVCVQRMRFTAGFAARRTTALLADGNDDVILHVHEAGSRTMSQFGREATISAGGGLLSANAEPSAIVLPGSCRFASIGVPRQIMIALAPGVEDAYLKPLPPDTGVLRLLMSYLDVLEEEETLKAPELQEVVAVHIQDLCALAIGATRDAAEIAAGRGLRAARMRAIKADITQNLDGDVTVAALSTRNRVSPRYIRKLFEGENTSLSQFVLGQRLIRVHRMLADSRYADRTIGDIALTVGFGDLSTFNRDFRRRFGMTPSDVRRGPQ